MDSAAGLWVWDESTEAGPRKDSQGPDAGRRGLGRSSVVCAVRSEVGLGSRTQLAHRSHQSQEGMEPESEAVASQTIGAARGDQGGKDREGRTVLCGGLSFLGHTSLLWS